MNKTSHLKLHSLPVILIAAAVLAVMGLFVSTGSYRWLTVAFAAGILLLLARRDLSVLRHPAALLLLVYVLVAGASIFWAMSGKFFLREYTKIFLAACLFVAVLLTKQFERTTVRTLFSLLCTVSAVYSVLSVEYVSTGLSKALLQMLIPDMQRVNVAVETGTRITGIFGSPNSTATMVALSILLGVYLMTTEEKRNIRMFHAGVLAANAFCFLLLFSMGATGFFALSLLIYLLADGKHRGVSFVGMLVGALPTLVWAFAAFPCFGTESALWFFPVVALVGNIVTVILLDRFVSPKLTPIMEKQGKLVIVTILGLVAVAVLYLVAAMNLGTAYTFGDSIRRSIYPEPGVHTLTVQADGDVSCTIISQNKAETIMHTSTQLYHGSETEITFEVPENSKVCYITFQSTEGITLESVVVDGEEKVILKYALLPGFISNRLQGLWANQNAIQRTEFFSDGIKVFMNSPIYGCGVGSFETAATSVQEFFYETKYIHNHYIQVLLECGVLGFVPFVGSMLCMVFLLLKKRSAEDWAFRLEYAPLCAALTMVLTHIAFEFSMSDVVVLCVIYVIFAILIRCCTAEKAAEPHYATRSTQKPKINPVVRGVCMVLPAVFAVSICCNLFGKSLLQKPVSSMDEFMRNLNTVAQIDPYEKNDAKLSYVMSSLQVEDISPYLVQSNAYAAELQQVQSNSIPKSLAQYYFATKQYDKALETALAGAAYSATDADTWNDMLSILRAYLLNPMGTPLYIDGSGLSVSFLEYYTALQRHNAASMEDIALDLAGKDCFGKLRSIAESDGSAKAVNAILQKELFCMDTACDANQDGIPDQVTETLQIRYQQDGTVLFLPGGSMTLELYTEGKQGTAQVTVTCTDPTSVTLQLGELISTPQIDGNRAVFQVPVFENLNICIASGTEQTVEALDVVMQ